MRQIFADSSFYVGFVNPADGLHARCVKFAQSNALPVVTSEYVLIEVGNRLRRTQDRPLFLEFLRLVEQDPDTSIIPASTTLLTRGNDLFRARPDKDWSLVDCVSMVIMRDHGITEVATADHHFQQAGFTALLR